MNLLDFKVSVIIATLYDVHKSGLFVMTSFSNVNILYLIDMLMCSYDGGLKSS